MSQFHSSNQKFSLLSFLKEFFKEWFSHVTLREQDPTYKEFVQSGRQKWDYYGFYLSIIMISNITFFGLAASTTTLDYTIKLTLAILVITMALIRKNLKGAYNAPFALLIWAFFTYYTQSFMFTYLERDITGFYLLGYIFGILEIIIGLSVSNIFNRLTLQVCLVSTKGVTFWELILEQPRFALYLALMSFFLISYAVCYDLLYKRSFRIVYQSREKLVKFQSIIADDFPISVAIVDAKLNSLIYTNQCFKQKFKLENSPDLRQAIFALMHKFLVDDIQPEEMSAYKQMSIYNMIRQTDFLEEQFKTKDVANFYAIYQKDSPEECWYEIKIRKIMWEDQSAYTIIFNDISDKQLVRALKIADEQKDRVIATVSHELRTPINGILGLLELVTCQVTDKLSLTYLNHCKSCSKLLLYLVNSILDLSQIRHNGLKAVKDRFNLEQCLEEVKSLYIYASQSKKIQFIVQKMPRVPSIIYTDQHRLLEILINLLGNAIKFTFTGHVRLKVSIDEEKGSKLLFEVEDTGIGIAEKDKSKLFRMFGKLNQSNKNINTQGVGLGLTIANELVKALNEEDSDSNDHKIHFESVPGKGSRFWFRIDAIMDQDKQYLVSKSTADQESFVESPVNMTTSGLEDDYIGVLKRGILDHRPKMAASSTCGSRNLSPLGSPTRIRTLPKGDKRVLIVDDNPFNLLAASFIMEKLGFAISTASHGQECLEMLEKSLINQQHFDIILMDIQMPLMDGLEASRQITEKVKKGEMYKVPIIGLTAQKVVQGRERTSHSSCGMLEVLEKPLVEDEIKNILNNLKVIIGRGGSF